MDPIIVVAIIAGVFGLLTSWQNSRLQRSVRTNHGKTIGQHVEEGTIHALEAKLGVEQVATELAAYKVERLRADERTESWQMLHAMEDQATKAELVALIESTTESLKGR